MEEEISLVELSHIIWKRRGLIISLVLVSVIGALIFSLLSPKIYEAKTVILLPTQGSSSSTLSALSQNLPVSIGILGISTPSANMVAILKSRSAAEYVFNKLHLENYFKEQDYEEALNALMKSINISTNDKENTITVTAESRDPKLAAEIANTYVEALEKINASLNVSSAKNTKDFLEKQIERVKKDLDDAENRLKEFQKKNLVFDVDSEAKVVIENLAKLESEKDLAGISLKVKRENFENLKKQLVNQQKIQEKDLLSITSLTATSTTLAELRNKLISQESDLALLSIDYGPEHPKVLAMKYAIEETKKVMRDELERIYKAINNASLFELFNLQMDIILEESKEKALNSVIKEYQQKLSRLPDLGIILSGLLRDVKVQETLYTMLISQYEQAKIDETRESVNISVLDYAKPPTKKSKPSTTLNVLIAGVASLFLGIFLVFFLNFLDNFKKEWKKLGG
ncbi:MAG TPA: GumC family protein [Dictyoglomaceae bacterium]|nr:GumC family protein [Dictyoglomaceae bacterium]HOL38953.1 GumC family protein [Dictyoglomaceae bacterium]HPP15630.1 GumC family protein [Dictyoglomaceae bacterium]